MQNHLLFYFSSTVFVIHECHHTSCKNISLFISRPVMILSAFCELFRKRFPPTLLIKWLWIFVSLWSSTVSLLWADLLLDIGYSKLNEAAFQRFGRVIWKLLRGLLRPFGPPWVAFWRPLGGFLEASWGPLGGLLGASWDFLGSFGCFVGRADVQHH